MENLRGKVDFKILKKYFEGKDSNEDKSLVNSWINDPDSEQDLSQKSYQIWEEISLDPVTSHYRGEPILNNIHRQIIEELRHKSNQKSKTRFINRLTKIAAVLFLPLLFTSVFLLLQKNSHIEIESYSEIFAPLGTRTSFNLPDGSKGWLNGGSSLKFPVRFSGKTRDVSLTGEAYFDVTSDKKKPFIVSTEYIDVNVTGTSFNVMAYPDDHFTEITLKEGQIELFKKSESQTDRIGFLEPNESCIYNIKSNLSTISTVNPNEKLAWLDGNLTFKFEKFEDVIRKINRKYNVDIIIKDEMLKSYTYYGTFNDETLEEVLNLLKHTAPIRYKNFERRKNQDGSFEKRVVEIYNNN